MWEQSLAVEGGSPQQRQEAAGEPCQALASPTGAVTQECQLSPL